jgi:RimJ/RimL family protein N-acetyltransferase
LPSIDAGREALGVEQRFPRLATLRLTLEPVTASTARAIVAGDLSSVTAADDWPHEGTANGLGMAIRLGHPPGWLVLRDGVVIGDCGIHGVADEAGCIEIGYGFAESYRGKGYGSEVVAAMTLWLLGVEEVTRVRAATLSDNWASRRVLEKAGYRLVRDDHDHAVYERESTRAAD